MTDHVRKPRKPFNALSIGLTAAICLLVGAGSVYAVTVQGDGEVMGAPTNETGVDGSAPTDGGSSVVVEEEPEAWYYTFTPTLGSVQFGLHVATVSSRDTDVYQSPNQTLDQYGDPRLEARVFALPFDVTQVGLGTDPFGGLSAAMSALGDAPSYATLRAKSSGTYMDFVAPYYMTLDGENVTALRSIAMTSTQTRQVVALSAVGQMKVWNPAEYATCAQYRPDDLSYCVVWSWQSVQPDSEGRVLMYAG